nr:transposon Ty3-I Gag-Pol polyprotein [Tanacetum cinerariifolium]
MDDEFKPVIQPQRRLNPKVQDVVKNEIVKLLDSGLIYPISDSSWVSPIHVVPKKEGMTDHFPLPFIDQMLERLSGNEYYCFLDGECRLDNATHLNSFNCSLANLDRMLASKHDAKPRLIWWVLLLQGFDIEIKDKKEAKNLAADHLSRLENPNLRVFIEEEIADKFPNKHLMMLKAKPNDDEPWLCPDNITRRCVAGSEILKILAHCHSGLTGGHHSALISGRKRSENISSRSEMPQNNI